MKKLIIGLLASFLMATGLVAFSGTSATAACPYTACVATKTTVKAPGSVRVKKKAAITVTVKPTRAGNGVVRGNVVVTIKKNGGGFSQTLRGAYGGKAKKFTTRALNKVGAYKVTVKFTPAKNSIYKASNRSKTFRVKK
ncbi:hypothetical protein [Nocardioides sp. cx-173]|uniref:hypothetical protein n=1 Tax=Nocardioides sp. cx-173 TaxID=2898796 RepID=UPI001E5CA5D3|nr:hypothetical protein [Nocardioides sp. cx-173]MCD4526927.1 hypothetical protein [Nocardioides sp. cx-173]UGB41285.1 hypothetical protein LQ940_18180 [Nocardioides sp. cx-173]